MTSPRPTAEDAFEQALELRRRKDLRGAIDILRELLARPNATLNASWRGRLLECLARTGEHAAAREAALPLLDADLGRLPFIDVVNALLDIGEETLARQIFGLAQPDLRSAPDAFRLRSRLTAAATAPRSVAPAAGPVSAPPQWQLPLVGGGAQDIALVQAKAAGGARNPGAALPAWLALLALAPGQPEALIGVGLAAEALGRHAEAASAFLSLLETTPGEAGRVAVATRYFIRHAARRGDAITLLHRCRQREPSSAALPYALGQLLEKEGSPGEAASMLDDAVALAPTNPGIIATLTRMLLRQRRGEPALHAAERWLALTPDDEGAQLHRLQALKVLGQLAEARVGYLAFVSRQPGHYKATLALASAHASCGALEQALDCWRRAAAIDPQAEPAWLGLIATLADAGREADTLEAFEACRTALGEGPEAQFCFARIAARASWHDRAEAHYMAAAETMPRDPRPVAALGSMLLHIGVLDRALMALRTARQLDPGNIDVAKDLARVTTMLGLIGEEVEEVGRRPQGSPAILAPERLFATLGDMVKGRAMPRPGAVPGRVVLANHSLAAGGAERQLVTTARGLAQGAPGVESVTVLCSLLSTPRGRDFYLPALQQVDCTVLEVGPQMAGMEQADPAVDAMRDFMGHFPPAMGPIDRWVALLRRLRPAVVHAWQDMTCISLGVASLLAGVPRIILSTRTMPPPDRGRQPLLQRWMREGFRTLLAAPGVRLLNNSRTGADAYAAWLDVPRDSIGVIYNGIDLRMLCAGQDAKEAARTKAELGIPHGAPVIGGVFRLVAVKRPLLWIETASRIAAIRQDAHFVVCGDGVFEDEMAALATTLGFAERLHLVGRQSRMTTWYQMMDAVLLTSSTEGLPNVLLEAQHFGVPVVVPQVGGAAEALVEGVTGFAVPAEDPGSLADRVLHCLGNAEWREQARRMAPGIVARRFGVEAMLAATLVEYGLAAGQPSLHG